jgi:predicted nucleic acid-binding protein
VRLVLWDASALAKRYTPEIGSDTVDAVFDAISTRQMIIPFLAYTETFALLVRKRNGGSIAPRSFRAAVVKLQAETLLSEDVRMLSVGDRDLLGATEYIERHAINSSDAALLTAFLRFQAQTWGDACLVIACDQRFLRAAQAEHLETLNPEQVRPNQIPLLLAG